MNILVLNIGSSSIKYSLFSSQKLVTHGYLERVTDYEKGMKQVLAQISAKGLNIDAVGHRVVHGGEHTAPEIVTPAVVKKLEKLCELAPLHNPPEVEGIKICLKLVKAPSAAVFDTAFHHTIPPHAHTYAIPAKIAAKHQIKRYGFHGISHKYVSHEAAKTLGKHIDKLKIITCHLGNGCSVCAIKNGKSIDTSMGFTPLEGLVMGSRSGDIDPALVAYIAEKEKMTADQVISTLNKQSGLYGISGKKDLRDILKLLHKRGKEADSARLAFEVAAYRLTKYIGAYHTALGGADAIVFTAGIGENARLLREKVLKSLDCLGVKLDKRANNANKRTITKNNSKVKVLVIPTNEELMIAREVEHLVRPNH